MRRLPPLTAIEAFVQVARLGSVKAAAEALSLSSPALSRRIQSLERFVGHPLFERRHQAVQLNPDGERLLTEIAPSIDALALAMERATGDGEMLRLRLAVPSLFASQRLMPSLPSLRAIYPDLHIDIDTGANRIARLDEGLDAAIAITTEVDPNLYSRRIDSNCVIAIGSREMQQGPQAITSPAQLAGATIFLHRDMPRRSITGARPSGCRTSSRRRSTISIPGSSSWTRPRRASASPSCSKAICSARPTTGSCGCSIIRSRAPTAIGSPAADRRSRGGRSGFSTTGCSKVRSRAGELDQRQRRQRGEEPRGHGVETVLAAIEIGGRVFRSEVAPALVGSLGAGANGDKLGASWMIVRRSSVSAKPRMVWRAVMRCLMIQKIEPPTSSSARLGGSGSGSARCLR
jgi:LysR family glycine cleavage system transcriptional activator